MSQKSFGSAPRAYVVNNKSPTRTFLQVVGVITLILIAAIGGFGGMAVYSARQLDTESKSFADTSLTMIASGWDEQALMDRASPQLLQVASPDQLKSAFGTFATLGHLVNYQGSRGDANIAVINWSSNITAQYVANAQFENGTAVFHIALVKRDGQWMINALNITPTSPVRPAATQTL